MPEPIDLQPRSPFAAENQLGYRLADWVARNVGQPTRRGVETVAQQGRIVPGLAGAGLGAGVGYGLGRLIDWYRQAPGLQPRTDSRLPRYMAALGGLGGGALGGYMGHARKISSVKTAQLYGIDSPGVDDALHQIRMRILDDSQLSSQEKQKLVSQLVNLSPNQAVRLRQIIGGLTGAALFAAVARFIGGTGRMGTMGAALAGAATGATFMGGPERTVQGLQPQRSRIFG